MEKDINHIIYLIFAIGYALLKYSGAFQTSQHPAEERLEEDIPRKFPKPTRAPYAERSWEIKAGDGPSLAINPLPTAACNRPSSCANSLPHRQRLKGWKRAMIMSEILRPYAPRG